VNSALESLRRSRFVRYWVPTIGYCLLIFVLSSISKGVYMPSPFGVDKVAHFVEYGVLGFLLARLIVHARSGFSRVFLLSLVVILATLYGISDEVHQAFVPGRNPSPWDVAADGLGGLMGAVVYKGTIHKRDARPGRKRKARASAGRID
jgi:VanZ family protein